MSSKKTKFMIAASASVVVVRDGKRVTISPGGGSEFTDEEIDRVNKAVPGALRTPVNEGGRKRVASTEDADDGDDGEDGDDDGDDETKKAAPEKAAAKKAPAKKAPAKADKDADED